MTTNVYDVPAGLMTSDSRWSSELDSDWIAYVDDTGYDKIVFDSDLGILFAGDLNRIDIWKQWFLQGRKGSIPKEVDGISIILVDMISGQVVFETDYLLKSMSDESEVAFYSGTGGPFAKDCWQVNRSAMRAVDSAISADIFSGGIVLHLCRSTLVTNVVNTVDPAGVVNLMKERGIMMNRHDRQSVLVKVAANDSSNLTRQDLANKVISGNVELSAPFPGISQPWTNEKKSELKSVLERYAPK